MKKSLAFLVGALAMFALAGCSSEALEQGPTGRTVQDPIIMSEFFDETITVDFEDGVQLSCYGYGSETSDAMFDCDWEALAQPHKLALPENSDYEFYYLARGTTIVPCLFYNYAESDGWSSCGFGNVKL